MEASSRTVVPWCVDGPITLHGYDDDEVYMLVRADTDDPEQQREIALVGAWDLEGERYARMIAAVPKLVAACQAVVDRWEHGDLAEAARMCGEAGRLAAYTPTSSDRCEVNDLPADSDRMLEQLVARAEAAGFGAEDLDETVHDLTASIAADVNNEGLEGQLRYLIDQLGGQGASQQLDRLAEERSGTSEHP